MRKRIGQGLAGVFAVASVGLMLALGSCDGSRVHAQTTTPDKCTEEWLRQVCGDQDWHICYFLYGCWLPEQPAMSQMRAR